MNNKKLTFDELVALYKDHPNFKCDDNDLKELIEWSKTYGTSERNNYLYYGYYALIVLIVIVVIVFIYSAYYSVPIKVDIIDAMKSTKNKTSTIDIEEADIEYDELGNEIMYMDD